MSQQRQQLIRLLHFADDDTTKDSLTVKQAMFKVPNVAAYIFGGDGPYNKSGKAWCSMCSKFWNTPQLMDKLIMCMGNHDCKSSESLQTQKDIEAWYGRGLAQSKWLTAKQIGNVYIIVMNTEDLDIKWKRDQYKWVVSQLQKATQLRASGAIDWLVVVFHKPFFTLKSSHSAYTDVRRIYNKLFIDAGVDAVLQGHNHNAQFWFPMDVDYSVEDNGLGKQLFTLISKNPYIFDFTKPHGPAYLVGGWSGHEWNPINDKGPGVKNVMWYGDGNVGAKEFGFIQLDFTGKLATISAVGASGKIYYQFKLSRQAGNVPGSVNVQQIKVESRTPAQIQNIQVPSSPNEPGQQGMRYDPTRRVWVPVLGHAAFKPKLQGQQYVPPKQQTQQQYQQRIPTKPPTMQQQQPSTSTKFPNANIDPQFGIGWFVAKGKITVVPQSRDEADDDRWSENVPGCELGFEATMIAKSIGSADHFAMKQGGSNHSGGGASGERWLDTGVRADGTIQLEWEGPHPNNHDFTLPSNKQFIKNIGKPLLNNWIGLKWAQIKLAGAQGSPANGGVRWLMWCNTEPLINGKPNNKGWRLVYDFIDGKDVKIIQPQNFVMKGEMDAEVRRSGTRNHEVYGGGLIVRTLR